MHGINTEVTLTEHYTSANITAICRPMLTMPDQANPFYRDKENRLIYLPNRFFLISYRYRFTVIFEHIEITICSSRAFYNTSMSMISFLNLYIHYIQFRHSDSHVTYS